ncbi:MAG: N-6 DNA methylase [Gemmatimonadaceae bacterium]|nr:N-6 DNA methylase [Gemmatimonadaceae bacterium]
MRKTYQFSLFGAGSGKGLLFGTGVLSQYLDDHKATVIPDEERRLAQLSGWLSALGQTRAKEASLEQRFLQDVFCGVLGYRLYPSHDQVASLYPKPPSEVTHIQRTPDGMLGAFSSEEVLFSAALELKTPGTELDMPQARVSNETPIEQAFFYGESILGVRWVLVSDMQVIRLYSVDSRTEYEEFDLRKCVSEEQAASSTFRRLYFLLHHDFLIGTTEGIAPVDSLYDKTTERQLAIRDSFYEAYYRIRADLYDGLRLASAQLAPVPSHQELLEATQRLLDRLLFIYYCEDHPQALIPQGTVKRATTAARQMAGPSPFKVYDQLKYLFHEVDKGSPLTSGLRLSAYNGELFKDHRIIDHVDLPDTLHDKRYIIDLDGFPRIIFGVWGLHEFDFWKELNEHLLGHIFEESLSDLERLGSPNQQSAAEKINERKANGIYYTAYVLSDFLSRGAIHSLLNDEAPISSGVGADLEASLQKRMSKLLSMRILDPACGSGAFLVSAYREMLEEYWRIRALNDSIPTRTAAATLFTSAARNDQATLLRSCLFGSDRLPQAVEIAKLALWLRSAQKGEKVADLGGNLIVADSLDVEAFFARLGAAPASFDLLIGNPPWGGHVAPEVRERALAALGITDEGWDSWELFVLLALRALREGGRLAFVLPDSLFYPNKARLRELLFHNAVVEKVYNLGPDWFGRHVRMGTVVLQARRGVATSDAQMRCGVVSGVLRTKAIQGQIPLRQIEAQRSRLVPVQRSLTSPTYEIEVFRGVRDDQLMAVMANNATPLMDLCDRARGEEMNKAGLAWICPSCLSPTTPGEKDKILGYKNKICPKCGHLLTPRSVSKFNLISTDLSDRSGSLVPFIDGDDVNHRYQHVVPEKWLNTSISGWTYKDPVIYSPPKILVRQAGLGVVATIDRTDSRCPQSMYIYKLKRNVEEMGLSLEFVLAALVSRTMAYYVFKRFSEVDPAKAHAKLTHRRLSELPIPKVDLSKPREKSLHETICEDVNSILERRAILGGVEDRRIELALRELWGLSGDDGAYINREFIDLPTSQVIQDLFPAGVVQAAGMAG